jgi:hypothetical protein
VLGLEDMTDRDIREENRRKSKLQRSKIEKKKRIIVKKKVKQEINKMLNKEEQQICRNLFRTS